MASEFEPKWQKDLDLYQTFKTTFILEGQVFDKQAYFPADAPDEMDLVTMDQLLHDKLAEYGYKTIMFFNQIDGFYNRFDKDAIDSFDKDVKVGAVSQNLPIPQKMDNSTDGSKFGLAAGRIRCAMGNKEEPVVIVLNLASRYVVNASSLQADEEYFYSQLFMATQLVSNPVSSIIPNKHLNNLIILVCNKLNDIPTWFYLNNPLVKPILLTHPEKEIRGKYFDAIQSSLAGAEEYNAKSEDEKAKIKTRFINLTDGLNNIDLANLRTLMRQEKLDAAHIGDAVTLFKYGIKENPWTKPDLVKRIDNIEADIKKTVKGQDICVNQACNIIKRAVYGLSGLQHSSSSSKPRGIMFLAGPTGTGKTELSKALATWLFGSSESLIRFDMSEYSQAQSDQRLLGAPPGYVGYESGGQLTNAVKKKPFSILLFDEIEKADKSILDKFLQILEDGRMTDGKGETVYFSETVIIFTSNLGVSKIDSKTGEHVNIINYNDDNSNYENYRTKVMGGISDYFVHQAGRPEVMNRIGDNFLVFQFINKESGRMIGDNQIKKIISNLKNDKNIEMVITKQATETLYEKIYTHLDQGGRGVGNAIEKNLINPLVQFMSDNHVISDKKIIVNDIKEVNSIPTLICDVA